jgi:hypothetical protein
MVLVYWLLFLPARHCRLMSDVRRRRCEHTKRVTCPGRGPVVFIHRVRDQGARQEQVLQLANASAQCRRAHTPPEDTSHAHVLLHTGMTNTKRRSYAKALQCRIHARPSSHNFIAPGRRKTEVEFLREASHRRLIAPPQGHKLL